MWCLSVLSVCKILVSCHTTHVPIASVEHFVMGWRLLWGTSIICCDKYNTWPFTPKAVLLSVAARRCVFALVELMGRNSEVLSPPCSIPRHVYCVVSGLASCLLVSLCFLCSQNSLALVLFFFFFLYTSLPVVPVLCSPPPRNYVGWDSVSCFSSCSG